MTLLGNVIWFLLGGWLLFLLYALGAVIFFPVFIPLFRLAVYSAWPFGREVVSKQALDKYRQVTGKNVGVSSTETALRNTSTILNILWAITFGWILALSHLIMSIANLFLFWLVVTIPNIGGNWKLMPVALMPFNKIIIPSEIAKEVKLALARDKLGT